MASSSSSIRIRAAMRALGTTKILPDSILVKTQQRRSQDGKKEKTHKAISLASSLLYPSHYLLLRVLLGVPYQQSNSQTDPTRGKKENLMADTDVPLPEEGPQAPAPAPAYSSRWGSLVLRAMSKRRTWVALFLLTYALLLSSSWNLLLSIRRWYNSAVAGGAASTSRLAAGWPALYASVLYGGVFGLLSMGAALAVAVPATVVTWITVLVLLAFAGKPRRALVAEGRRITADIAGFAAKVLVREGNLVAALGAAISFVALLIRRRGEGGDEDL